MRRLRQLAGVAVLAWMLALCVPQLAVAASARTAALQVALKARGLYPGAVDGVRGPLTRAAVIRFQRRRNLAVDGVAGPQTRAALGRRGRPWLGSRLVRRGLKGWDVAALQYLLARRGYPPGAIDGVFGPVTDIAVRNYQRGLGLASDGVVGPNTLASLRSRSTSPSPSPQAPVRFLRPVAAPINSVFGEPRDGGARRHSGLDFKAWTGTRVGAAGVGVTEFVGRNQGGYGNLVVIRHRLGFTTWYAHLSAITTYVGESVNGGTRIGLVGTTGNSTGPHLHFEVRRWGTPIDPMPYLLAAVASSRPRSYTCWGGALVVNYKRERIDDCGAERKRPRAAR